MKLQLINICYELIRILLLVYKSSIELQLWSCKLDHVDFTD